MGIICADVTVAVLVVDAEVFVSYKENEGSRT